MKILLFSDLHAHPFKSYSYINEHGINSRLQDALNCIDQIIEYTEQNQIDMVLFGGDLFHIRQSVDTVTLHNTYERLIKLSKLCPLYMLVGNHDQADKAGKYYSTSIFSNPLKMLDTVGISILTDKNNKKISVCHIPFTEDREQIRNIVGLAPTNSILLGHLGISGAMLGADFVFPGKEDASLEDLSPDKFLGVFLGHFHMHQKLHDNAWYIGAPLQHTWGDKSQKRGFCVWDSDVPTKFKLVGLKSPKFIEVLEEEYLRYTSHENDLYNGNFVKYLTTKPKSDYDEGALKKELKCNSLEIISSYVPTIALENTKPKINTGGSILDILDNYVDATVDQKLDSNKLKELGKDILKNIL